MRRAYRIHAAPKVRFANEQMSLHLDILFAKGFFHSGVWGDEWQGTDSNPTGKKFLKFNDANFDPVHFFDERRRDIKRRGRHQPNRLALGYDAYLALKEHPDIVERVKYTGSTANPAIVTQQVLAQVLGFEQVKVLESTYNVAKQGEEANMQFICDSNAALMCYATNTPQVDEAVRWLYFYLGYVGKWFLYCYGSVRGRERNTQRVH